MDAEKLVESVARAIYEEDDPWHKAWPWPDLQSDQAGVDQYRRIARAALAEALPMLEDDLAAVAIGYIHPDPDNAMSPLFASRAIRARFDALAKEVRTNG